MAHKNAHVGDGELTLDLLRQHPNFETLRLPFFTDEMNRKEIEVLFDVGEDEASILGRPTKKSRSNRNPFRNDPNQTRRLG